MPALYRTIDALVLDADALDQHDVDGALRARIERLAAQGVHVALLTARPTADLHQTLAGLRGAVGRVLLATTRRAALYDVGPEGVRQRRRAAPVPAPRAAQELLLDELDARGVPPGNVLTLDGLLLASAAADLLDEQLRRRAERRVPEVSSDSAWAIVDDEASGRRPGTVAALFSIGDGNVATRESVAPDEPGEVLATGVYTGTGPSQHLLPGPVWHVLGPPVRGPVRRALDLRVGLLLREELEGTSPIRAVSFASAARPGLQLVRAEGRTDRLTPGAPLRLPIPQTAAGSPAAGSPAAGGDAAGDSGTAGGVSWARTADAAGGGIVAVAEQEVTDDDGRRVAERVAVYRADPCRPPGLAEALDALAEARALRFDALLAEHRQVWARRWADVDVEIPADPDAQQAFRYALFQLWTTVGSPTSGEGRWSGAERAVGARGLSGQGYAGHVFWDSDVFVLPAMATICPAAARAMLEYRARRLPAARARAAGDGRDGARFPWESARDGDDVTPTAGALGGEVVPIRTGQLEEHISADVAWAAQRYATWTGDDAALAGPARPLVVETARYWASRVRWSADGRAHIDGVIGPDEYHEDVDDNAFTNLMARWNLRRAAELTDDEGEATRWRTVADALVDGYDLRTGRHEQFAGYDGLVPLLASEVASPPFAADLVLGPAQVRRSQVVKQPDVLMAHFLVPQLMPAGSLAADLRHYVPRTSHGSSLSPAVVAALLARAGRADEALATLRIALRMDLDDVTVTTAGGLHLATIGGVWQALVHGFLGMDVRDGVLWLDPHLPSAWPTLSVRLRALGARVAVAVGPGRLTVSADRPIRVQLPGTTPVEVRAAVTLGTGSDGSPPR